MTPQRQWQTPGLEAYHCVLDSAGKTWQMQAVEIAELPLHVEPSLFISNLGDCSEEYCLEESQRADSISDLHRRRFVDSEDRPGLGRSQHDLLLESWRFVL
jgi:hypothetical protein